MPGAIPILIYLQLFINSTNLRQNSITSERSLSLPQGTKHAISFPNLFYQIHINMTNDCVSITKTLMMGVKLMRERPVSYFFLHNNDCKTPYIDIYIDLLWINFNLLSVLKRYAYHQISEFEIYTSLTTMLQLNTQFFLT